MIFTSRIAKDLYLVITRLEFDPVDIKQKLDFFLSRNRITQEEYDYLMETMEQEIAKDTAEQLAKIKPVE